MINSSGEKGEGYYAVNERVKRRYLVGERAERRTMNENPRGCRPSVNLELELIGLCKDCEVKEIDLHSSNLQGDLYEGVKTFGAFIIRVRRMYLLTEPKNEDHVSGIFPNPRAYIIAKEGSIFPSPRGYTADMSLYRGKARNIHKSQRKPM